MTMIRKSLTWIFSVLVNIFMKFEKEGMENIPTEGPGIIVFNHIGRLEIVLVLTTNKRYDLVGWMAEKYKGIWWAELVLRIMDSKLVDRYNPDLEALRWAQKHLKKGGLLGIAPEGTRSPDFSLKEGRQGVAYLAAKTNVPIIPAGVAFESGAVRDALLLKRPKVAVRYGKPFYLPEIKRDNRKEVLEQGTDDIMCQIAALLPPSYRGIYADHPRTTELLAQDSVK